MARTPKSQKPEPDAPATDPAKTPAVDPPVEEPAATDASAGDMLAEVPVLAPFVVGAPADEPGDEPAEGTATFTYSGPMTPVVLHELDSNGKRVIDKAGAPKVLFEKMLHAGKSYQLPTNHPLVERLLAQKVLAPATKKEDA